MDFSAIKIEKGVPIERRKRSNGFSHLLRQMKQGDSIVLPIMERQNAFNAARNTGAKISTRMESDSTLRVWRIK